MDDPLHGLTIEQRFEIAKMDREIEKMTLEQAKDMLRQALILMARRDTMVKQMLKGELFK